MIGLIHLHIYSYISILSYSYVLYTLSISSVLCSTNTPDLYDSPCFFSFRQVLKHHIGRYSGLANFSWNSTPPNIQGTQTSYPLNSQKKFEEQNYTKPLLLPTITTGIWRTLSRFQLWLNTFNSYTPLYSKMNCLSGSDYEEINPFRNQLLASKRFSNLNPSHLDSQPT